MEICTVDGEKEDKDKVWIRYLPLKFWFNQDVKTIHPIIIIPWGINSFLCKTVFINYKTPYDMIFDNNCVQYMLEFPVKKLKLKHVPLLRLSDAIYIKNNKTWDKKLFYNDIKIE